MLHAETGREGQKASPAMKADAKRRIFLSKEDLSTGCRIVRAEHPRTAQPFAVALANGTLLEVSKFQEPPADHPRSWLLAGAGPERVQQDGTLFVATPLDPLFLLLPHLRALRGDAADNRRESSAGLFRPFSDLAAEAGSAEAAAALEATALALPDVLARCRAVCDVNDKYDEPMVRLNDEKLVAWLRRKVEAVKALLASDADSARLAASQVADAHTSQFDEIVCDPAAARSGASCEQQLAISAVALVAEYLDATTQSLLCAECAVAEAAVSDMRGPEKKGVPPPALALSGSASSATTNSTWANDVADADAEVSGGKREGVAPPAAPPAKKAKPAAPAKSKAASVPLKKGQKTMMGFFAKPK